MASTWIASTSSATVRQERSTRSLRQARLVEEHHRLVLQTDDVVRLVAALVSLTYLRPRSRGTAPGPTSAGRSRGRACPSLRRAISASMASGTTYTRRSRPAPWRTAYSTDSTWFAYVMSMTEAGMPSAAPRLTRRPSASSAIWRPSGRRNSSMSGRGRVRSIAHRLEGRHVDLDVEVAGVGDDGAVAHHLEVLGAQHVLVAGDGDEDVTAARGIGDGHHAVAVHDGLQRAHRVDLEDDHVGAHAARTIGDAAAREAVARDDHGAPGEQHVGGADDAVDGRLAGAVAVLEQVLRLRLVDGDDRERQHAVGLHRLQPHDAGGRALGADDHLEQVVAAVGVEHTEQVGAVVDDDRGPVVEGRVDVRVVGVVVLAANGERGDRRTPSTRAAATSSCVETGFEAHSSTWAPPAAGARMRFAVSAVTCMHAAMRMPSSGRSRANRSRMARSTGMSRSAHPMRPRPSWARERSLTSCPGTGAG